MQTMFLVALGGAVGAVLRYLTGIGATRYLGAAFWGTMAVNVIGSFVMGLLFVALTGRDQRLPPLLMTGFLGGFTTFSAYSLDALKLMQDGRPLAALGYAGASVLLGLMAVALGVGVMRGMTQ
jgi:CrcB protein